MHVRKFGLSHELTAWETHNFECTFEIGDGMNVDLINFDFSLLSYSLEFTYRFTYPYLVSFNFLTHTDEDELSFLILTNSFMISFL